MSVKRAVVALRAERLVLDIKPEVFFAAERTVSDLLVAAREMFALLDITFVPERADELVALLVTKAGRAVTTIFERLLFADAERAITDIAERRTLALPSTARFRVIVLFSIPRTLRCWAPNATQGATSATISM